MNLPNALTLLRILLVPAFLIAVIYRHLGAALALFALAAFTDLLDGYLARRWEQKTVLGAFLDPVADKLLMTVSFVSLAVVGLLPAWLAVLAVAKDLFVSLGIAILYLSGKEVAAIPTLWGKQTTFLQVIAVFFALLLPLLGKGSESLAWLFVATGAVTIFSGTHYIFAGIRSLSPEGGRRPNQETPNMMRNPWALAASLAGIVLFVLFLLAIRSIAVPFMLALILAYFLDPAADYLEARRLSRPVAVCVVFAAFAVTAAVLFIFLVPAVKSEVAQIQKALPSYAENLYRAVPAPVADILGISGGADLQGLLDRLISGGKNISSDVLKQVAVFLSRAFSSTFGFLLAVLSYFIIPVYLFYLLRDFDRMKEGVAGLIPRRYHRHVLSLGGEIDGVLGGFIRGQLSVCLVLAVLYSLGLAAIGIDLALVIGIGSGLAFIIPYLGTILGIIAATLMAALKFHDLLHPLLAVGWFLVVQGLEGAVITPRLVGDRVGLHPLATILAVLIGGELFGFFGLLLAVPVAASANVIQRRLLESYRQSDFFGALAEKGGK